MAGDRGRPGTTQAAILRAPPARGTIVSEVGNVPSGGPPVVRRLPLGLAALALLPFLSPAAAGEPRTDRSGDPLPDGAIARLGTVRWRHPGEATAMMFSPNGKILAATCRGGLLLWDTATGKVLRRLPGTDCGIGGPDFTPDGHTLVAQTSTGDVGFWDVPTGKL